jgi:hypothetical protein
MDGLNAITPGNTSCCVQVSHALNKAGVLIPSHSFRRPNTKIDSFFYLLAVDELEIYLAGISGRGEDIKKGGSGNRSLTEMKNYIDGRQGILVFRNSGAGHHTELWDKNHILQDGKMLSGGGAVMNESNIFGQPRVLFWDVALEATGTAAVPSWLLGWWHVNDGVDYYYYFSDQHVVTYTKTKPANLQMPPNKVPMNEGSVKLSTNDTVVTLDWNPADGGETREIFTRQPSSTTEMSGVSNRYGPLKATKM